MLYTPNKDQQLVRGHPATVAIPEGYTVLKIGDIVPVGSKVYMGDVDEFTPWHPLKENCIGGPVRSPIGIYIAPLPKMDNWETLVIRICKGRGNKPYKLRMIRRALARRCGLKVEWVEECFIFSFLFDLAKRYKEINFCRLVEESEPKEVWKVGMEETDSHFLRFAANLVAEIRRTEGDKLIGYVPHARFRNSQKKRLTS
jgi:hypothetical protein